MLYWLPAHRRLLGPAVLGEPGRRDALAGGSLEPGDRVDTPAGCTIYPHDLQRPPVRRPPPGSPTSALERTPRGGHFPALEQPEVFAAEVEAFFDLVR